MAIRLIVALLLAFVWLYAPVYAQVSPESGEKYNAGQELYKKRRYQEALTAFDEAVQLDGDNAQAYLAMGTTYEKLRDYGKAIESYGKAASVKPDYAKAFFALGQAQFKTKKYGEAQANFKQVLALDATVGEGKAREYLKVSYMKQGFAYLRRKSYKQAIQQYRSASQLDPTDAVTFYNLGLAYRGARSYSKAADALSTAADLDPTYAKAHKSLGDLYRTTKKYSQAARAYGRAIDADKKYKDAYLSLAQAYLKTTQPTKAVSTLKRAAANIGNDSRIYLTMGSAYANRAGIHKKAGRTEDATSSFKLARDAYLRALKIKSKYPEARYRLADAYLELNQYKSAIASARKALGSRRYSVPANVIMGDAYEAIKAEGWKEKAISHYEKGLKDRRYKKYCEDKIDRIKNPMGIDEEEEE
ncbi:MAG: tetratricopeptide repeat protein [Candidatus Latescibacteria bacterium]|jgi:tetratricopeptide (TPR) repeat protein|nr:tetratricopeptide repeat protein [Candidatus Latescibacterota bacterium]